VGCEAAVGDGGGGEATVLLVRWGRRPSDPAAGATGDGGGWRRRGEREEWGREKPSVTVRFSSPKRWVRPPMS
jgi:hypothetical protein